MVNIRIVNTLNTGGILNFTFYSRFPRSLACSCFVGSDDMVEYAILMSEAVSQKGGGFRGACHHHLPCLDGRVRIVGFVGFCSGFLKSLVC
jgi:hypothetical protein